MDAKISQISVVVFEEMSGDKTYRIIVSGSGLFMLGSNCFIVSVCNLCLVAHMRAEHNIIQTIDLVKDGFVVIIAGVYVIYYTFDM